MQDILYIGLPQTAQLKKGVVEADRKSPSFMNIKL